MRSAESSLLISSTRSPRARRSGSWYRGNANAGAGATRPFRLQRGGKSVASLPGHSQRCYERRESSAAHLLRSSGPMGCCWGRRFAPCRRQGRRLQGGFGVGCLSVAGESWSLLASVGLRRRVVVLPAPRAPVSVWYRRASWHKVSMT